MVGNITPGRHALLNESYNTKNEILPMTYWSRRPQRSPKQHRQLLLSLDPIDSVMKEGNMQDSMRANNHFSYPALEPEYSLPARQAEPSGAVVVQLLWAWKSLFYWF